MTAAAAADMVVFNSNDSGINPKKAGKKGYEQRRRRWHF
jgi:hypothetical protein